MEMTFGEELKLENQFSGLQIFWLWKTEKKIVVWPLD